MGAPRRPTVQCGAAPGARTVEWHGYVLRAGAVTVGCGEDAAVPHVGLEVVTVSVVDHGAGHAVVDDGGRGGRPVDGRLQSVRLAHTHLCGVAHALESEGRVPGGLLAEVGPSVLDVGYVRQLMLIPGANLLLLLCVVLELLLVLIGLLLLVLMLQVVLLLGISRVRRQVVHGSHRVRRVGPHWSRGFLLRAEYAVRRGEAGVVVVHGDPGAGADQQVAADGAGVGDLALTHGGGSCTLGPGLTELIDLVHDGAQVGLAALVQPCSH